MDILKAIIGITPIILSILIIVLFKRNTVTGALVGVLFGLAVITTTNWFTLDSAKFLTAVFTSAILTISAALGMLSGNITGSNVGGNALMMTLQQSIGASLDNGLLFAAVQNSAAGFAVFTSSAIVVLTMTIAKNFERNSVVSEHQLVAFGLKSAFFIYLALILGFWTTSLIFANI